jgi:hypothetical protein
MSKQIFEQFNKMYFDFLGFLKKYSNGDKLFQSFYNKNHVVKNMNIKLLIKTWYEHITSKYHKDIIDGNISFFLNKNYEQDVKNNSDDMIKYINYFKKKFKQFETNIVDEFVGYIKNLTRLSYMYFNAKDI